jgi:hypothetical protein
LFSRIAHPKCGVHQVLGRHHLVHQFDAVRLVGVDDAAGQHELAGHPRADDPRQHVAGAHIHRREAGLDEHRAESGLFGGDPDIGVQRERQPAADRRAVDRGDHRIASS